MFSGETGGMKWFNEIEQHTILQKQPPEVFYKKEVFYKRGVLKYFTKFGCFTMNFRKFLRTPFLQKILRLLLILLIFIFTWRKHLIER